MRIRYDSAPLEKPRKHHSGYLRCDGYVTRVGVLTYHLPDGSTRREFRPPEEVFRTDSLETLKMVPVTDGHPPEGLLKPEFAKLRTVGYAGENIRVDGQRVAAPLVLHDKAAIDAVESKKRRELSAGYLLDLEMKSGVWNGQRYDAIQRNIRYNHIALTDKGRAGPDVAIRLDGGVVDIGFEVRNDWDEDDTMLEFNTPEFRSDGLGDWDESKHGRASDGKFSSGGGGGGGASDFGKGMEKQRQRSEGAEKAHPVGSVRMLGKERVTVEGHSNGQVTVKGKNGLSDVHPAKLTPSHKEASIKALDLSDKANNSGKVRDHEAAREAHGQAYEASRNAGESTKAAYHSAQIKLHSERIKEAKRIDEDDTMQAVEGGQRGGAGHAG